MASTAPAQPQKAAPKTSSNNEAHVKLIAELQGQTMHVPNMLALFPNWPARGRSKYYRRLKGKLDAIVDE